MRKFFKIVKTVFSLALAFGCALFLYALFRAPAFETGSVYSYYLGTSSAPIITTQNAALTKFTLGNLNGEGTCYAGDHYEKIKEKFAAELLFQEEAAGVINYYMYSPKLSGGVSINGYLVNLHVAVTGEQTKVGTPIIFGGY